MIIVAGITRSGLTLAMQMLHAGGYPCAGSYPAFEEYPTGDAPWGELQGKAVKLVDAHLQLPRDGDYSIIRLHRNMKEQAKSFNKFISVMGFPPKKKKILIKSFIRDYKIIDRWAKRHNCLRMHFEDMINNPAKSSQKIAEWCPQDLDIKKMESCIIKRSPDCYPTFLELSMSTHLNRELIP